MSNALYATVVVLTTVKLSLKEIEEMPAIAGKTQKERILEAIKNGANNQELIIEMARVTGRTLIRLRKEDSNVRKALENLDNAWSKKSKSKTNKQTDQVNKLVETKGISKSKACKQVGITKEMYYKRMRERK